MNKYTNNKARKTILGIILVAIIALAAFMAGNNIIAAEGSNNATIGIILIVVGIIGFGASVISKNRDYKK